MSDEVLLKIILAPSFQSTTSKSRLCQLERILAIQLNVRSSLLEFLSRKVEVHDSSNVQEGRLSTEITSKMVRSRMC